MRLLCTALLLASAPALAAPPAGGHAPADAHAPAGHGDAGNHGDAGDHGEGHGAHHTYTDDDDHDGVPNWRDPMNGTEPNEDTYVVSSLAWHAFNFTLLMALFFFFVRRPVLDVFRERALGIRKELTDSARQRDEAHQKHQELLARLEKIEGEVRAMEQQAEVEAKREEEKLVERAQREAARLAEQAERNIRDEAARARHALRQEAVELAVKLAEGTLRQGVSHTDQQALARQFLQSIKDQGAGRV